MAVLIKPSGAIAKTVFGVAVRSDDGFKILVNQVIANFGFERISWTEVFVDDMYKLVV